MVVEAQAVTVQQQRRRSRAAALVVAYPAAAWLTGLIALSFIARFAIAYWMPVPWYFADELQYSELAKSLAKSGTFAVRDVPGLRIDPLYSVLIAPAYALFESVPHAYLAIKAINCLMMSLAAIPAYLLARRFVSRGWGLVVAALTLAIPSYAYTGMVLTENLFLPLFLVAVLTTVRALERPTARRQLVALAVVALAALTRPQALALVLGLGTALLLVVIGDRIVEKRPLLRGAAAFLPTIATFGFGVVALASWQTLRGRSLTASFGDYAVVLKTHYSLAAVSRWLLWHTAELDLYTGIIPFAAFILLASFVFTKRDRKLRVFASASISVAFWLLITTAAFVSNVSRYDSHHSVARISDRYTFYLVPLMLIALAAWLAGALRRPPLAAAIAGATAATLVIAIPYDRFTINDAIPDSFALMPWAVARGPALVAVPHVALKVALIAFVLGALFFLLRPPRFPRVVPVLVFLNFLAVMSGAQIRVHGSSAFAATSIRADRGWVDAAIGSSGNTVLIWSGRADPHVVWENEFFNRSVGDIYYLRQPSWSQLHEQRLVVRRRSDVLVDQAGHPLRARYALVDPWVILRGRVVARDRTSGMRLYRLSGGIGRIAAQ